MVVLGGWGRGESRRSLAKGSFTTAVTENNGTKTGTAGHGKVEKLFNTVFARNGCSRRKQSFEKLQVHFVKTREQFVAPI